MANVAPATMTITSTTGPGQALTSNVIHNVVNFSVDFVGNKFRVQTSDGLLQYFDYSAMATVTWTISGGLTSITITS